MRFKRRHRRPFFSRIRNFLFPAMGWRRYFLYWRMRTLRLPGSASSIAKGFACGAAASFTPFLFFHMIFTLGLCWVVGGNYIAGAIGTLLGNPLTLFPILFLIYWTGSQILGQTAESGSIERFVDALSGPPEQIRDQLGHLFEPIFLPMLVGCVPVTLVVWVVTYILCYRVVNQYRHLRLQHRMRRAQHDRAEQHTPDQE